MEHNQINIERTVLSSYLLQDMTLDAFKSDCRKKLNKDIFIMPFHRRIAEKINEAIEEKKPLPFLFTEIQDKIIGTYYENELLLIEATNPLSNSCGLDWYIDKLQQNKIKRELNE